MPQQVTYTGFANRKLLSLGAQQLTYVLRHPMRGRHAGIDLGTSNSVVAVVEEGLPRVLPDEAGCITTPSWVTFTDVRCAAP